MPVRFFSINRTTEQIEATGLDAIYKELIDNAMAGELAFLTDGREYFVRVRKRAHHSFGGNAHIHQIQVIVEWAIGNYEQAEIGEFVHGRLLCPDYKGFDDEGQPIQSTEATRGPKAFTAEAQGWRRVS